MTAATKRVDVSQDVLDRMDIRLGHVKALPPIVPLAVSYGCGVDSTAMLIYFHQIGVCPDRIQFADTYAYLPTMNRWLRKVGFPEVTVVHKRSKHKSLYHNMVDNNTLPGLAFGYGTCALKWKIDPMNYDLSRWERAKRCWKAGYKIVKAIGYDASGRDQKRFCESFDEMAKNREKGKQDNRFLYWYPLVEAGIDRETCKAIIQDAGLPVPIKSACNFCPARKKDEIMELVQIHPQLAREAVVMEKVSEHGIHGIRGSTVGLGRTFKWADFLASQGIDLGVTDEEVETTIRQTGCWDRYNGVRRERPEPKVKKRVKVA
jgi:hypothetical protein